MNKKKGFFLIFKLVYIVLEGLSDREGTLPEILSERAYYLGYSQEEYITWYPARESTLPGTKLGSAHYLGSSQREYITWDPVEESTISAILSGSVH